MAADDMMNAMRVHEFGPPEAIVQESIAIPSPEADEGQVQPYVGTVLPFAEARSAHEMLERIRPAKPGKIVLVPELPLEAPQPFAKAVIDVSKA